jgi:hypothetical protein
VQRCSRDVGICLRALVEAPASRELEQAAGDGPDEEDHDPRERPAQERAQPCADGHQRFPPTWRGPPSLQGSRGVQRTTRAATSDAFDASTSRGKHRAAGTGNMPERREGRCRRSMFARDSRAGARHFVSPRVPSHERDGPRPATRIGHGRCSLVEHDPVDVARRAGARDVALWIAVGSAERVARRDQARQALPGSTPGAAGKPFSRRRRPRARRSSRGARRRGRGLARSAHAGTTRAGIGAPCASSRGARDRRPLVGARLRLDSDDEGRDGAPPRRAIPRAGSGRRCDHGREQARQFVVRPTSPTRSVAMGRMAWRTRRRAFGPFRQGGCAKCASLSPRPGTSTGRGG